MKKTIAAVLTALAMVVALVIPMTAFADDKTPTNVKPYEESFKATADEPEYDVEVEDVDEEDVEIDIEVEDVDVPDADVDVDVEVPEAEVTLPTLSVKGLAIDLADGDYDIDYSLTGTGTMKLVVPALLTVKGGQAFAKLAWNDPEVDKLYLNGEEILPVDYTKSHNISGKLPVFEMPLSGFNKDIDFDVHTRGVNLELDQYKLNMKEYNPNFDATALQAKVQQDIEGAQPVKFYKWHTGMSSSLWGPFAFLGAEAVAIAAWIAAKKNKKED